MLAEIMRHLTWRRRVRAAHEWRDYQRAEYEAAMQRILAQAPAVRGAARGLRS